MVELALKDCLSLLSVCPRYLMWKAFLRDSKCKANCTLFSFVLEFANQVLDTSLKETSSTNLTTAGVAMSGTENADLTNEENSGPSKKPNETSLMIGPQEHYLEIVALRLGDEKNTAGQTEDKREKFTCRICEENEAVVALKPCGHITLCTGI